MLISQTYKTQHHTANIVTVFVLKQTNKKNMDQSAFHKISMLL